MNSFLVSLFLIILIYIFIEILKYELIKRELKDNKHPFHIFKDEKGNKLPIVAVTGFFRSNKDKKKYYKLINSGIKVIGVTAYREFPKKIYDITEDKYHLTDDFNYTKNIKVWLYCMNNYKDYGFRDDNTMLEMSESDFYTSENMIYSNKKYDFIYICLKDDDKCSLNAWQSNVRNFQLALKCFPIMCEKFKLKGIIVGRVNCGLEDRYKNFIETTDFLPYEELQQKIRESRFLFVPNISDASPRVVAESLIKNVPILMNVNIICGSKYINDETGIFFNDENDISEALNNLLFKIPNISPQEWWNKNYSKKILSIKLRNFLYKMYPDILKNVEGVYF